MKTTTILLARHGETDWNRDGRVQGHADEPLNDTGRAQALALAERLASEPLDAVYASDLRRASETAALVATRHGLAVELVPDLRERHFGTWEGLTDTEILQRFPDVRPGHWGDGETVEEMSERVLGAVIEIARAHRGGRVLVVAHGGPLRAMLFASGADRPEPILNCDVILLTVGDAHIAHAAEI